MTTRPQITILALAVLAIAVLPVSAQNAQKAGKPPAPPPDVLGTAWIDNDALTPCGTDPGTRIHSDCLGADGAYTTDGDGNYPKLLGDTGAIWLQTYANRYVTLNFSDLVPGTVLCGTKCYRQFGNVLDTTVPRAGGQDWTASLHGNVIDAAGNALPNGLRGLAVGDSSIARFFVNFPDPEGGSFHWTVFFNPTSYPDSDFVTITRTAACIWQVESNGYGELVAGGGGKNRNTREGLFWMPFRIVFEAPSC